MVTTLMSANQNSSAVEHQQRDERWQPLWYLRQPELHVDADRGDFRHHRRDPREPVGPAGHEPGQRPAELIRIRRERARYRAVGQQLPECAHDEEDRHPAERIGEQQSGAGVVNGLRGAEEQADTDRSADRDQLDVAVAQVAGERGWML
jgi:hypothetical protein